MTDLIPARRTPRRRGLHGLSLAGILAFILTLAGGRPALAQVVHVCVEPADTTIALGDYVTVRVTTSGPPADLKGYSFRCTYNPAVLTLMNTTPGSVLSASLYTFFPFAAAPDTIGFDAAVLIGSTMGPGTLGYFTLHAVAPGICDFVPSLCLMRNSFNQPYTVDFCNGRVRVVSVTPVSPRTWSEIKTGRASRMASNKLPRQEPKR